MKMKIAKKKIRYIMALHHMKSLKYFHVVKRIPLRSDVKWGAKYMYIHRRAKKENPRTTEYKRYRAAPLRLSMEEMVEKKTIMDDESLTELLNTFKNYFQLLVEFENDVRGPLQRKLLTLLEEVKTLSINFLEVQRKQKRTIDLSVLMSTIVGLELPKTDVLNEMLYNPPSGSLAEHDRPNDEELQDQRPIKKKKVEMKEIALNTMPVQGPFTNNTVCNLLYNEIQELTHDLENQGKNEDRLRAEVQTHCTTIKAYQDQLNKIEKIHRKEIQLKIEEINMKEKRLAQQQQQIQNIQSSYDHMHNTFSTLQSHKEILKRERTFDARTLSAMIQAQNERTLLDDQIDDLKCQLYKMKEQHQIELDQLKKEYLTYIGDLKKDHLSQIGQLKNEHLMQTEQLENKQRTQIKEFKNQHHNEIEQLKSEQQTQIQHLKDDYEKQLSIEKPKTQTMEKDENPSNKNMECYFTFEDILNEKEKIAHRDQHLFFSKQTNVFIAHERKILDSLFQRQMKGQPSEEVSVAIDKHKEWLDALLIFKENLSSFKIKNRPLEVNSSKSFKDTIQTLNDVFEDLQYVILDHLQGKTSNTMKTLRSIYIRMVSVPSFASLLTYEPSMTKFLIKENSRFRKSYVYRVKRKFQTLQDLYINVCSNLENLTAKTKRLENLVLQHQIGQKIDPNIAQKIIDQSPTPSPTSVKIVEYSKGKRKFDRKLYDIENLQGIFPNQILSQEKYHQGVQVSRQPQSDQGIQVSRQPKSHQGVQISPIELQYNSHSTQTDPQKRTYVRSQMIQTPRKTMHHQGTQVDPELPQTNESYDWFFDGFPLSTKAFKDAPPPPMEASTQTWHRSTNGSTQTLPLYEKQVISQLRSSLKEKELDLTSLKSTVDRSQVKMNLLQRELTSKDERIASLEKQIRQLKQQRIKNRPPFVQKDSNNTNTSQPSKRFFVSPSKSNNHRGHPPHPPRKHHKHDLYKRYKPSPTNYYERPSVFTPHATS